MFLLVSVTWCCLFVQSQMDEAHVDIYELKLICIIQATNSARYLISTPRWRLG
jgi:hypothetical protein